MMLWRLCMLFTSLVSFLFVANLHAGISAETLVKVPHGRVPIKHIAIGDTVICMNEHAQFVERIVTCVRIHQMPSYMRIFISEDILEVSVDQKIYLAHKGAYEYAHTLTVGDGLRLSNGEIRLIRDIDIIDEARFFYDISVEEFHNFFAGNDEILVHNVAPLAIGLTWAFGGGIQFVGASLTATLMGITIGWKLHKNNHDDSKSGKKSGFTLHGSPCGASPEDPEEFKKKHPHGRYEDAPYHKSHQSGHKSPRPRNGQAALDNSVLCSERSGGRVGISDGEFVVLKRTSVGEYHGYAIDWWELEEPMRRALIESRMATYKGKIL